MPIDPPAIDRTANRLAIAHLLLWMTTTAVVLAFLQDGARGFKNEDGEFPTEMRMTQLLSFAFAPAYGASLAAVVLALWRRATRRYGFPTQPGHWLLLVMAVSPLSMGVNWIFRRLALEGDVVNWMLKVAFAAFLVFAATRVQRPPRWRLTFVLVAAGFATSAVITAAMLVAIQHAAHSGMLIFGILLLLAFAGPVLAAFASSILDLTAAERFDIFHWAGTLTYAAAAVHPLIRLAIMNIR